MTMQNQVVGLQFTEKLAGGFSLNTDDPKQGCSVGKRKGFELTLHVVVEISDLNQLVEQQAKPAAVSGTLDFTPMGKGLNIEHGQFKMFYPGKKSNLKLMLYEIGFTFQTQDYYLVGKKEVRNDPGFDLWADTTTLLACLHKGRDSNSPVVGAGILTEGITDLVKMVSSIKVTHAHSSLDKVAAIAKFGQYFMGELWDSYVKTPPTNS